MTNAESYLLLCVHPLVPCFFLWRFTCMREMTNAKYYLLLYLYPLVPCFFLWQLYERKMQGKEMLQNSGDAYWMLPIISVTVRTPLLSPTVYLYVLGKDTGKGDTTKPWWRILNVTYYTCNCLYTPTLSDSLLVLGKDTGKGETRKHSGDEC